jgi:hypothetical protein
LDQAEFKSDVFAELGKCWNLEFLDITGCRQLDDQAFVTAQKCEATLQGKQVQPGLNNLTTAKIAYTGMTDFGVVTLAKIAPNIEHFETNRLDQLTEYSLKYCFKELPKLKFWDLNGVTAVTYQMLDEFK